MGTPWSASPAQMAVFRAGERPCLAAVEQRVVEEETQCPSLASVLHAHEGAQLYTHMHAP